MSALQVSGWLGAVLSFGAYMGVARGVVLPAAVRVCLANLAASCLLGYCAYVGRVWGYVALNVAWGAVALAGLVRRVR